MRFIRCRIVSFSLFMMLLATAAPGQQQFTGSIAAALQPVDQFGFMHWNIATPAQRAMFVHTLPSSVTVHIGAFELGTRPDLKFTAALVEQPGEPSCLYVDTAHHGRFTNQDRTCFRSLPQGSPYAAEATLQLPLTSGPYRSFPIDMRLPLPSGVDLHDNTMPTLEASFEALVTGFVKLPTGRLLVGYVFDPGHDTVDPTHCRQFADLNGDGKLDPLTERDDAQDNIAPVFHVGHLFLRTTRINLNAHRLTLASVDRSEYKRFDLWPGGTIPNFVFKTLDGTPETFKSVKGRLILIDFWATWCPGCVADLPSKKAVYAKYHSRGFEILGIDGDPNPEKARRLVARLGLSWPQGRVTSELLDQRFHVTYWPKAILVDGHGRILNLDFEQLSGDNLDRTVGQLLTTR